MTEQYIPNKEVHMLESNFIRSKSQQLLPLLQFARWLDTEVRDYEVSRGNVLNNNADIAFERIDIRPGSIRLSYYIDYPEDNCGQVKCSYLVLESNIFFYQTDIVRDLEKEYQYV